MLEDMVVGIGQKGGIWTKKGGIMLSKGIGLQRYHVCEYFPKDFGVVEPNC